MTSHYPDEAPERSGDIAEAIAMLHEETMSLGEIITQLHDRLNLVLLEGTKAENIKKAEAIHSRSPLADQLHDVIDTLRRHRDRLFFIHDCIQL